MVENIKAEKTYSFSERLSEGLSRLKKKDNNPKNIFSDKEKSNKKLTHAYEEYISANNKPDAKSEDVKKLSGTLSCEFLKADKEDDGKINFSVLSSEARKEMEAKKKTIFDLQPVTYEKSSNPPKRKLIDGIVNNINRYDLSDNKKADGSIYNDKELGDLYESLDIADDGQKNGSIFIILDRILNPTSQNDKQDAIDQIKNILSKMMDRNYDALSTGKTPGIANEKFEKNNWNIPADKPAFIKNDNDWKKIKELDPQMQGAAIELYKRADAQGISFNIKSGLRSNEEQRQIAATARPGYAAQPGKSQHEFGRAIDIAASTADKEKLGKIWQDMGFKWGKTFSNAPEDWHFDIRPA